MFETQGGTRNRTRDLPKKGSAFITSSDHWTDGADIEGPDKACSTLGRQMMLPLRHGGLGLHMQSDRVSDAAFVAGVGQAERNLKGRSAALCPLQGAL